MLSRFFLYGCTGWVLEVLFTGAGAALKRDRSATATTYLWMHPIYGGTALALEQVSARLESLPRPVRALAYTALIFGAEYTTGWLLRRLLGRCPWDYSPHRWSVNGLIRLDYAPAWYLTALLFEPVRDGLRAITLPSPRHASTEAPPSGEQAGVEPDEGALQVGVVASRFAAPRSDLAF
ncbi:putative ABC transporter permease [Myxococcus stipitatus]|uniref:putative ABC transporter permease n=1 Tax=Myxococcus stipitatus TaxID=83455 RepID=UPI0030D06A41